MARGGRAAGVVVESPCFRFTSAASRAAHRGSWKATAQRGGGDDDSRASREVVETRPTLVPPSSPIGDRKADSQAWLS